MSLLLHVSAMSVAMRVVVIGANLAFTRSTMTDPEAHVERVMGKAFMPTVAHPQRVDHIFVHSGAQVAPVGAAPVTNFRVRSLDNVVSHVQREIFKLQETNQRMKVELEKIRSQTMLREEPSARAKLSDVQNWAAMGFGFVYGIGAALLLSIIYRFFVRGSRDVLVRSVKPSDGAELQSPAATAHALLPSGAGLRTAGTVMSEGRGFGGSDATRDIEPGLPRRIVLSMPPLAALAASRCSPPAAAAGTASFFSYTLTSMQMSGVSIPVAIWRPADVSQTNPPTYPYTIDIGKIAAKLRVGWLSWLPKFDYDLPCGAAAAVALPDFPRARENDAILFAHGFLGSVYDFAHAAEALAADGFTVVAPELPESLSASYIPPEGLDRTKILAATRGLFGNDTTRWGIFGHSAGAGSALMQPEACTLGRVCFAGGAGRLSGYESNAEQPLFVCSSNGDGCNSFMGLSDPDLRKVIVADGETVLYQSLPEAFTSPARPPARSAFIFAADNSPTPLPCHISFLWSEVDNAMVSLLSPLLPLAKALGLFLLDFDVYRENKDAEATASLLVPALRRFFLANSAR